MFRVEMLPAREGDALLLSYGDDQRLRHVLVDGGRAATYKDVRKRLAALPDDERTLELLIVTHVDRDHIEGVLKIVEDATFPVAFRDVWFNGYAHLQDPAVEPFGAAQGERLSDVLVQRSWNRAFDGRSVETRRSSTRSLPGKLRLTLLSPDRAKLEALIPRWELECRRAGLVPGVRPARPTPEGFEAFGRIDIDALAETPFEPDDSEPNGTSIVILAEYGGCRVLLAGDAHADLLEASVRKLASREGGRLRLDAFKLPHHGSRYNVSRAVLELVDCRRYLLSTNGSQHHHPHREAIARVIKFGGPRPELVFNYRSPEALVWDNARWQRDHGYTAVYPSKDDDGTMAVKL